MDDYRDMNELVDKALRKALAAYDAAADKFISKVESGEARSKVTYAELKAARKRSKAAQTIFTVVPKTTVPIPNVCKAYGGAEWCRNGPGCCGDCR